MTREEIDIMWQHALRDSVRDGEMFTRYHFAKMVAEKQREVCAKVCEDSVEYAGDELARQIRARGDTWTS